MRPKRSPSVSERSHFATRWRSWRSRSKRATHTRAIRSAPRSPLPVDLLVVVALFALQALLIAPLFTGEFTRYRGSIEAAYITDARFIVDHFPDLTWNPFWYLGFPFEWFYTPLLPALVALVGKLIDDVPAAYRLVAASGYALGPAALYVATRTVARSRIAAIFAALALIFLPSVSYLLPG